MGRSLRLDVESVTQVANNLSKALFQISVKKLAPLHEKVISRRHLHCSDNLI